MKLKNELKRIIEFGPSASCWRLFAHFNQNLYSKKHKSILKFLKKHFFDILQDGGKLNIEESKIDLRLRFGFFGGKELKMLRLLLKRPLTVLSIIAVAML